MTTSRKMSPARNVAMILLVAVIAILIIVAKGSGLKSHWLGPGWDCQDVGRGDPVCMKKPAASEKPAQDK